MKNKYYRKIIVDNKEYDWIYIRTHYWSNLKLFDIYYEFNERFKKSIRKRRILKEYNIRDFCEEGVNFSDLIMTPKLVKRFIEYKPGTGFLITKKYLRKKKLKILNENDFE